MVLILSLKLRRVREIPLEKDYSFFDVEQNEEEEKLSREFFSFFFASLSLFFVCVRAFSRGCQTFALFFLFFLFFLFQTSSLFFNQKKG